MQLFKENIHIRFMRLRKTMIIASLALMLVAVIALAVRGLNLGLDFTGGTLLEIGYAAPVELSDLRDAMAEGGYPEAVVQHFGTSTDVLIRIPPREGVSTAQLADKAFDLARDLDGEAELRRQEFVGPQVGDELANDGGLAMVYALFGILVYVALRFQSRFALGAVAALVHDVVLTVGLFALLQLEFDLTVLAALLAVIGYSLNDTIVVFDRIRENFRRMRKATPEEVIDTSLNQTLSRTIITSVTTMLVLVALFLVGGELIRNFSLALIIGIIIGTYSSIYIGSGLLMMTGVNREDLMPVKKEGADLDEMP